MKQGRVLVLSTHYMDEAPYHFLMSIINNYELFHMNYLLLFIIIYDYL